MVATFQERVSYSFWWFVALGITGYLVWGAYNTIVVIME